MKKGLTEIVAIIDKSGSMGVIANDARGGFNQFLSDQKKVDNGDATMTLILFDTSYTIVKENAQLDKIKLFNDKNYVPSGATALLDAIGRTIDAVGMRLKNTPEDKRPEKVIFCVLTDGEENSSTKYSLAQIKSMITHQRDTYKWEFIYLGANQDSFAEAGGMGFARKDIGNFEYSGRGVTVAYNKMSAETVSKRATK